MLCVRVVTANDGYVLLFFSKIKLSPLFVSSGAQSKKELCRFKYLVYMVLKYRYFICPKLERNWVTMNLKCFDLGKLTGKQKNNYPAAYYPTTGSNLRMLDA